jgi:hypothetical protein
MGVEEVRPADALEADVDRAIMTCDGDLRATIRALLVTNALLLEHNDALVKELDWAWHWVSPGYTRSTNRRRMKSGDPD